ncbi:serine hydrolase [Aureibaculum algae]|uniref:Serine hydrolase n=1 Tax=Aureibaculum algae TaxID=2584122 RepID=A0A5B7TUU4_9FLAO|nr:serine hydrolase [Aureibaculum algae]QCX38647.1 serine hydrolase [Aureibaculum algae]
MKKQYIVLLILLLFSSHNILQAQQLEQKIDSILELLSLKNKPGVELFVKSKSDVLYHKAFGNADLDLKIPLKINSVYNIASVSKEFTAMSILQLAETGKLKLGDAIKKYLPEFPTGNSVITIENLLTHTSGIKRHTTLAWAEQEANKSFQNSLDVINYFKQDSLDFKPDEKHAYVNMNYILLGYIIEKVSGLSYEDYIKQHIFEPLEMAATFYPTDGQKIANKPIGYEIKNSAFVQHRPHSYSQLKGAGGIHSTAQDLAKWYRGLVNFNVVSKALLYKAWSPYTVLDKALSNYGYGFYTDEKFDKLSVFHNGFIFGYATSDLYFPEDDLLILVFSNVSAIETINTNTIAFDVASVVYDDRKVELTEDLLESYVGMYVMKEGFKAEITRTGLRLFVEVDGQPANELFATTKNTFRVKDFPAKVEFKNDGPTTEIVLAMGPDRFEGVREK